MGNSQQVKGLVFQYVPQIAVGPGYSIRSGKLGACRRRGGVVRVTAALYSHGSNPEAGGLFLTNTIMMPRIRPQLGDAEHAAAILRDATRGRQIRNP